MQRPRNYLRHRSVGQAVRAKEAREGGRAHDVKSYLAFETLIHGREGIPVRTKVLSHPQAVPVIGWGAYLPKK